MNIASPDRATHISHPASPTFQHDHCCQALPPWRCLVAERCHVFEVPMASCQVIEHRAWTLRCDSGQRIPTHFWPTWPRRCSTASVKTSLLTATDLSQNDNEIHRFFLHDYTRFLNVSMLENICDKHVTINAQKKTLLNSYIFFCSLRILSRANKMSFLVFPIHEFTFHTARRSIFFSSI